MAVCCYKVAVLNMLAGHVQILFISERFAVQTFNACDNFCVLWFSPELPI